VRYQAALRPDPVRRREHVILPQGGEAVPET
jgi:hypothetical protein